MPLLRSHIAEVSSSPRWEKSRRSCPALCLASCIKLAQRRESLHWQAITWRMVSPEYRFLPARTGSCHPSSALRRCHIQTFLLDTLRGYDTPHISTYALSLDRAFLTQKGIPNDQPCPATPAQTSYDIHRHDIPLPSIFPYAYARFSSRNTHQYSNPMQLSSLDQALLVHLANQARTTTNGQETSGLGVEPDSHLSRGFQRQWFPTHERDDCSMHVSFLSCIRPDRISG